MEKDPRRGHGLWRGCHAFKNIICDDESGQPGTKRNGGLKMGNTYYYYYELDGSSETHDPSMPSTTTCPFMPGQEVNSISVPVECSERRRSASLSSMRSRDYKTMNPDDKFVCPRPAPAPPVLHPPTRVGTAPSTMHALPFLPAGQAPISRSSSPWRRLLRLRSCSRESDSRRSSRSGRSVDAISASYRSPSATGSRASEGSRSRDISPESLFRFLSDDTPIAHPPIVSNDRPALFIPDDIDEEEDEDYFTPSATFEHSPYVTSLSPPPFKRNTFFDPYTISRSTSSMSSPGSVSTDAALGRSLPKAHSPRPRLVDATEAEDDDNSVFRLPMLTVSGPRSRFSTSTVSTVASPLSPCPPSDDLPPFLKPHEQRWQGGSGPSASEQEQTFAPSATTTALTFVGYSLPSSESVKHLTAHSPLLATHIPSLGGLHLLDSPITGDVDDSASDIGWAVGVMGEKL